MRYGKRYFSPSQPKARVEVIPMIDIMMFLLVFFVIVSLRMIEGSGLNLNIPTSKTSQEIKSSTLTIGVDSNGILMVDGEVINVNSLQIKLSELKEMGKLDIILAGDEATSLGQLITVMDAVRGSGINNVAIAARAADK
tara:strand:- start:917 stop:1333 length:417 start_codon:yes stop_codon:yes gene_type:complete